MSLAGWLSNGERGHCVVTESHTESLICLKLSNVGGCDPVRWLRFLLLKQCDALGGDSGQEEHETVQV